jgi:hypothetical protein
MEYTWAQGNDFAAVVAMMETDPWGGSPTPQTHVGEPNLWVRTHERAYMASGMGGQNGCLTENFLPYSYHGHYCDSQ